MKKIKEEKGSITLFVLVAMLFFLAVGITIFSNTMNAKTVQEKNYKTIQKQYNNMGDLNEIYRNQKVKANS